MRRKLQYAACLFVLLMAFFSLFSGTAYGAQDYTSIYNRALQDAMLAEDNEIYGNLVSIDPNNKSLIWKDDRVLVVTWTKYPESYPAGREVTTWWGDTWVTAAPELKDFISKNNLSGVNTLRVEQLLGLPPDSGNTSFAELWVKPQDIFRPAPDKEINNARASLTFDASVSSEYKTWFNNAILSQYYGAKKYPWTRLGYTYDWGNPCSEIGLSEFVIRKGSSVIVNSLQSNEEYLQAPAGATSLLNCAENLCAASRLDRRQQMDTIFQVSTINALLQGGYDGVITCGNLKDQGDFGIGTFEGLDGEMVELNNVICQVKADGKVYFPGDEVKAPFASVTFFEADCRQPVKDLSSFNSLQQTLDKMLSNKNMLYAIRLDGVFKYVKTRSVPAQKKPYPPLAQVTASQPTFEYENIRGTLAGFWCPQYLQGINVPGYHLHFISEDMKYGGHLLDCQLSDGLLQIDRSADFHLMLPGGDEFGRAELSSDRSEELNKVEK